MEKMINNITPINNNKPKRFDLFEEAILELNKSRYIPRIENLHQIFVLKKQKFPLFIKKKHPNSVMDNNESERERERLNVSKEDVVILDAVDEKIYLGCIPSSIFNVIWLGVVFMLVFTSFAPTQVYILV